MEWLNTTRRTSCLRFKKVRVFPVETFTRWTDQFVVPFGEWKALRSDSIQLDKEITAASIGSGEFVINKWKSCVHERQKVRDCPVHHSSADPTFGSFFTLRIIWRELKQHRDVTREKTS